MFIYKFSAQALSGVFLAEQIRQQQLAAALESRLDSESFSAMQAALLLNKMKSGATAVDTSSLLAAAASNHSQVDTNSTKPRGRGRPKSRPNANTKSSTSVTISNSSQLRTGDKLNKNTVASLLAKSRELSGGATLTSHDLEQAERSFSRPELTIEPIFRSSKSDNDQFDSSDSGRRFQSVMEDGKLKIKTISDSPEIRNLSDHEDNIDGYESDDMQATVSSSLDQSALAAEKGIDDGTSSNKSQTLILADVATNVTSSSVLENATSQATFLAPCSTTSNTTNITSMFPISSSKFLLELKKYIKYTRHNP